jgi:formamidopyrimidine-DNA glycosylase
MPELPEVETTLQGLIPHLIGKRIDGMIVRQRQLRWLIPYDIENKLNQAYILKMHRRGKYLLIDVESGTLIIHLGMSGSLRLLSHSSPLTKHDHVDIIFATMTLRYTDPRRFGAILWTDDASDYSLLKNLGIEPLENIFTGHYLFSRTQHRHVPIKSFIMDSKIVVGIGNIYAAEALFLAGIHPLIPASRLTEDQCYRLVKAIKQILRRAIKKGGTTLKDFMNSDGKPGYFSQQLKVYGRAGLSCVQCGFAVLQAIKLAQRNTVFCPACQLL